MPLARPRTAQDNATPAANGKLAEVFARLWHLTGDAAWRERAEALLRAFMGDADHLAQMPTLLAAADLLEAGATVVVVVEYFLPLPLREGAGGGVPQVQCFGAPLAPTPPPNPLPQAEGGVSWLAAALAAPDPATVVLLVQATDALPALHPAHGKAGGPAAYVCRGNVCSLPIADPATLAKMLHARA